MKILFYEFLSIFEIEFSAKFTYFWFVYQTMEKISPNLSFSKKKTSSNRNKIDNKHK